MVASSNSCSSTMHETAAVAAVTAASTNQRAKIKKSLQTKFSAETKKLVFPLYLFLSPTDLFFIDDEFLAHIFFTETSFTWRRFSFNQKVLVFFKEKLILLSLLPLEKHTIAKKVGRVFFFLRRRHK